MPGTRYPLEVNPEIPPRLARLEELANNLWYSWNRPARELFARLNLGLWRAANHSPKAFLKRIDQHQLTAAAADPIFLDTMDRVLAAYDAYHATPSASSELPAQHAAQPAGVFDYHTKATLPELSGKLPLQKNDLIAYFCAEFGFHESLPIYSGGLGILSGDHCKAASDMHLPFVAVGLLYRQGYFRQTIDRDGKQQAHFADNNFDDMPIESVRSADGLDAFVGVDFPGRKIWVKLWQARIGNVRIYLLDTDIEKNSPADRDITHQLYGGDRRTRIEQEILLGVGGVRALRALGLQPTVWHINEGHAAFLVLERIHELMAQGQTFATALEATAANTLFTTHTPVPAGHDHFADDMVMHYFDSFCTAGKLDRSALLGLGHADGSNDFNMTTLALHGSRFQNGVSRIHGKVSANICSPLWPQVPPSENPMDYVTNAVHVPSFLSTDWYETFDRYLGIGWQNRQMNPADWAGVHNIPDQIFWSIHQSLKAQLLHLVRNRVRQQQLRNQGSEAHVDRLLRFADPANPTVLTIGFARRFATYKRATLLFNNLDWLREILCDTKHPVLFIFAGKAHPADEPGQQLIRQIAEFSQQREFAGRILLLEDYDLHLSRRLVAGVDVWLNNPVYPLEASGTSGMKAAINGAINLSVLDGWWGEGYDGKNGWAISPSAEGLSPTQRDHEEARTLYEILQDNVIPLYYKNTALGYSPEWVAMAKHSIASIMPRFNMLRMLTEYTTKFYAPAAAQWGKFADENFTGARQLAEWKTRIRSAWPGVHLRRLNHMVTHIRYGEALRFEFAVQLNGLKPEDLTVEMVFTRPGKTVSTKAKHYPLRHEKPLEGGEALFSCELTPEQCGKTEYQVRAYPSHTLLTHPFEMGLMLWL
ncbi:MAG TPA: alpha-glucan family phosphorylase [Rugosibacter sp.]|nr:alpha-glucan family phosphorylase [Rugosibacter sp.]